MGPRAALAAFLLLGVLHLWPLSSTPWRLSLNYNADAEYNAWAMTWIVRALSTNPTGLFEANIFFPEPSTLAYSEPLVAPALAAAPILLLGGSPVLAFNLSLFAGLVLTAWAMWFVAREWTGSPTAALVAGALAAFNVHLLTRLPHVQAAHAWGLPLTVYLADRAFERPGWRSWMLLALSVTAIAMTSVYWLSLSALILLATALARGVPVRRTFGAAMAATAGLILAAPVLLPYIRLANQGAGRPLEMVADFSAELTGYFSSTSVLHAGWSAPFYRDDVNVLFAGVTAIGLAAVGLWTGGRGRIVARHRLAVLVLLASAGVILSLGPATPVYRILYEWLPPLHGLRAAARFGFLYLLAIAGAAAFGLAWLERRARTGRGATAVTAVALVAVTAEVWQGPVRTEPFSGVPPIYGLLADDRERVVLAEVPFWPPDAVHRNGEYVLGSTSHWRPLMNGYSGLTPMSYRRRTSAFWYFPEERAIQAMRDEGVTHVMVHLEQFGPVEGPGLVRALVDQRDLRFLAGDSRGHRLYRLRSAGGDP